MCAAIDQSPAPCVCFDVRAHADAGLLPRALVPFARRGLIPDTFSATLDGDILLVAVAISTIPPGMVHLVAGNLRQIIGVLDVAVGERRSGPMAGS